MIDFYFDIFVTLLFAIVEKYNTCLSHQDGQIKKKRIFLLVRVIGGCIASVAAITIVCVYEKMSFSPALFVK